MQRPLPHPLGPCCLGTCLSAAAWDSKLSSCELLEMPGSSRHGCKAPREPSPPNRAQEALNVPRP